MESMPAPSAPVTVGVDTHLDTHVGAVVDQAGRLLDTKAFAASTRGYVALVTWAERFGPVERIGIEGTGTYGAGLARFARANGLVVRFIEYMDVGTTNGWRLDDVVPAAEVIRRIDAELPSRRGSPCSAAASCPCWPAGLDRAYPGPPACSRPTPVPWSIL